MITSFFSHEDTLSRLGSGAAGPYIKILAAKLVDQGFSKDSGQREIRAAAAFGKWLADQGVPLNEAGEHVGPYLARLSGQAGSRPRVATGAERLLQVLQDQGIVRSPLTPPNDMGGGWVAAFDRYLQRVANVAPGTRAQYLRFGKRMIEARFGDAPPVWSTLTPRDLTDFVIREASRGDGTRRRGCVSGTRAFLKFLILSGEISPGLPGAIPRVRECRLASLPRCLPAGDVARLLSAVDEECAAGLRDKAILLILARLGLRAGEVAHLDLDDINWREGRLVVRSSKVRRERSLPLPHDVGVAIARYLKEPRPRIGGRALFLRCNAPRWRLTSVALTCIAIRHMKRLGVKIGHLGAHALRHTVATELVRRGATFKEVADLLGHRRLGTTQVYAKLDLGALAQVALPWPGAGGTQ